MKKAILVLSIFSVFGCERQPKSPLTMDKISNGEQLQFAQELSVAEFFQIWIRRDIPWKGNLQISELYKDDKFVYFFEQLFRNQSVYLSDRVFTKEPQLFKVHASNLQSQFAEYATIDGFEISKLCAEKIAYTNEGKPAHLPAHLFKYKVEEQHIRITITINGIIHDISYDMLKKEIVYYFARLVYNITSIKQVLE